MKNVGLLIGIGVGITAGGIALLSRGAKASGTVTEQLAVGGWNEIIFKSATTPIRTALSSIPADVIVTVWSEAGQGFKSDAPDWANDLKQMEQGLKYFIQVSREVTWTYTIL